MNKPTTKRLNAVIRNNSSLGFWQPGLKILLSSSICPWPKGVLCKAQRGESTRSEGIPGVVRLRKGKATNLVGCGLCCAVQGASVLGQA